MNIAINAAAGKLYAYWLPSISSPTPPASSYSGYGILLGIPHFLILIFSLCLSFCIIEYILWNRLMEIICVGATDPAHLQLKFFVFCRLSMSQVNTTITTRVGFQGITF
jgi:hypothetical protein